MSVANLNVKRPSIADASPFSKPYQPFGALVDIFYSHDDEIIVDGPAGTGKSRAILEKMHLIASKYDGARLLMVRKTRESLTQSAMVTFETKVIPSSNNVVWRTTEQEYRYANGSKIVVGGMDKSSKIMSTDYDFIYPQEVTELAEGEYEDLTTRCRNGIVPYQQILSDCNPGPATSWVKRRFDEGKAKRIQSTHKDNPSLWDYITHDWTPAGVSYLRKLNNLTGVRLKRLAKGEWVSAEGVVYTDWSSDVHLVDRFEIPKEWRRICTIDFGFTNPFVCQWWALNQDDDMFLYREIYMTRRTVKSHAQQINELNKRPDGETDYIEAYVCDHDAEDRATLEEMGIWPTPADKAISVGLEKVTNRLKDNKLFVLRDSLVEPDQALVDAYKPIQTLDEFDMYVWPDRGTKEMPVAANNHGMDGMRYGVMYVDTYSHNGGIFA